MRVDYPKAWATMLLTKFYTMTIELNVLEVIDLRVALKMRIIHLQELIDKANDDYIKKSFVYDMEKLNSLLGKL